MDYNIVEPSFIQKISAIYGKAVGAPEKNSEKEELIKIISDAGRKWKTAEESFNEVADPELVDWAIYDMMAAKARYSYLIKKAKETIRT